MVYYGVHEYIVYQKDFKFSKVDGCLFIRGSLQSEDLALTRQYCETLRRKAP